MRRHDARQCVYCWENRRGRTNYRGHWGYRKPRPSYVTPPWEIAAMKRPHGPESSNGQPLELGEISRLFPLIVEYLTATTWDDGSERELATLMMFVDGNRWKLCLNDRALSRVAFMTGKDPEEALSSLEDGLQRDSVDWRPVTRKVHKPGRMSS
jgi:hypothetical protein